MSVFLFFFFKQKTAYEMRISDWSSDVCSSDLDRHDRRRARGWHQRQLWTCRVTSIEFGRPSAGGNGSGARRGVGIGFLRDQPSVELRLGHGLDHDWHEAMVLAAQLSALTTADAGLVDPGPGRSEEHTSELQSLMRISYA